MIGVVIVAYDSGPVIVDCIESLLASQGAELRVVIVDNASKEPTSCVLRDSKIGKLVTECEQQPPKLAPDRITLVRNELNLGFAGGVNVGLRILRRMDDVDLFWILNPDCVVETNTAAAIVKAAEKNPDFDIMGGRICYYSDPKIIQNDGGRVNLWTGICRPVNMLSNAEHTALPDAATIDYICAAHIIVSRKFMDRAGLMPEEYFLYYEEADWCLSLKNPRIVLAQGAICYHHGGTSIGSATIDRKASPLSTYFMARSRMRFVRKHRLYAVPIAFGYNFLKAFQLMFRGNLAGGIASLRGSFGLPPSKRIRAQIGV